MATSGNDHITPCPVCNAASRLKFSKHGESFFGCGDCGLVFLHPRPDAEKIISLYDKSYYDPWGMDGNSNATELMKKATFHDKLNVIERYLPEKGRILDVGCATGFFLEAARERGWDVYGVELSEYSSALAREKLGQDRIITGPVETAGFEQGFFDAVVMTDVIEHVLDVRPFMAAIAGILRPNGVSAITTPNPSSLSCRLLGRHWPHYKLEHLAYFTPRALSLLIEPLGFRRVYLAAASKTLTFDYLSLQLRSYPVPAVSPAVSLVTRMLPESLLQRQFSIYSGELFDISVLQKRVPA